MKLQKILSSLQKLHPKEIDLSLDRIKRLCKKLGNPQDNLKYISVVGTNGKYSTIQVIKAILKDANINCNIYISPHIQKINERYEYNNQEISDEELRLLYVACTRAKVSLNIHHIYDLMQQLKKQMPSSLRKVAG